MAAGSANSFVMHAPRLFVQSARRLIFSLCETVNVIQRYLSLSSALQMLSKHYGLSGECPKATNDVLLKSRGSKCNIKYAPRWISESWGGKAHDPEQIVHCCLWVHIFRAAISICLFFFIFYLISSDLDNFKTQTVRSTVNVREGQGVVLLCGPPAHSGGNLLFGIILAFWSINPHIFFSSDRALWNVLQKFICMGWVTPNPTPTCSQKSYTRTHKLTDKAIPEQIFLAWICHAMLLGCCQ